jgi:hypothetical protein
MSTKPESNSLEAVAPDISLRDRREISKAQAEPLAREEKRLRFTGALLALLPVVAFVAQYLLSLRAGTQGFLFHHLTVMVLDWVFVPFNFFVVQVIDWEKGGRLYLIASISVALNALTHAYWQYNGLDLGHMISPAGIVLPAGWVHLVFSSLQMVLLVAFVFCRKPNAPAVRTTTVFATLYFITMGICGYLMHGRFIASDLIVFISGLFFVLVYPGLIERKRLRRPNSK